MPPGQAVRQERTINLERLCDVIIAYNRASNSQAHSGPQVPSGQQSCNVSIHSQSKRSLGSLGLGIKEMNIRIIGFVVAAVFMRI